MGQGPQPAARVHDRRPGPARSSGHHAREAISRGEEGVDDVLVLLGLARTGGVDEAPARRDAGRRHVPACGAAPRRGRRNPPRAAASGYRGRAAACPAPSTAHRAARDRKPAREGQGGGGIRLDDADHRRAAVGDGALQQFDALLRGRRRRPSVRCRHGGRHRRRLSARRRAAIKDAIARRARRRAATRAATPRPARRTSRVASRLAPAPGAGRPRRCSASGAKRPGATSDLLRLEASASACGVDFEAVRAKRQAGLRVVELQPAFGVARTRSDPASATTSQRGCESVIER